MKRSLLFGFVLVSFVGFGCTKKSDQAETPAASLESPAVVGRKLYMQYCVACHNSNPKEDGMIGPANAGSSLELLKAKVLKGEYPDGYHPKRATKSMPPIPTLKESELEALHAFLNQ